MNTPQKERKLAHLQVRALSAERELRLLSEKIKVSTEANSITVDPNLHDDLCAVEEQFKADHVSRAQSMKWHPMMVRWCLNLSTSCYHALRTSGFIKLPSERTLQPLCEVSFRVSG